jgi:hypothetical protein
MTVRNIRYLINPQSACPAELLHRQGLPQPSCDLDLADVGLCAIGEVLQTAPAANPFFGVFEELLVPGQPRLIWRESGPGRGKCDEHSLACSVAFSRGRICRAITNLHGSPQSIVTQHTFHLGSGSKRKTAQPVLTCRTGFVAESDGWRLPRRRDRIKAQRRAKVRDRGP